MSASKGAAEEVLRLDAEATPGPWESDGQHLWAPDRDGVCEVYYRDDDKQEADADLIAAYRTAAPELAREVQRLQAAVAYRPGLPSVEQVRAHEARGGLWMTLIDGRVTIDRMLASGTVVVWTTQGGAGLAKWAIDDKFSARPCLSDGTPCPWGDQ